MHAREVDTLKVGCATRMTALQQPSPADEARREAAAERGVVWCAPLPPPPLLASSMSSTNSSIQSVTTWVRGRHSAMT